MMGLLKLIPDWGKVAAGGVLGALLAVGPVYLVGKSAGRADVAAQAAKDALSRIEQRERNDANFKTMPAIERCRAIMRDSGLPVSECDQRSGVSGDPVR